MLEFRNVTFKYEEDEEPMILVSFTAAFVNPYSDERALATGVAFEVDFTQRFLA